MVYHFQEDNDIWGDFDAFTVALGPAVEEIRYSKTIGLQLWLFGYEVPDTILLFTKSCVYVITSKKKGTENHETILNTSV